MRYRCLTTTKDYSHRIVERGPLANKQDEGGLDTIPLREGDQVVLDPQESGEGEAARRTVKLCFGCRSFTKRPFTGGGSFHPMGFHIHWFQAIDDGGWLVYIVHSTPLFEVCLDVSRGWSSIDRLSVVYCLNVVYCFALNYEVYNTELRVSAFPDIYVVDLYAYQVIIEIPQNLSYLANFHRH